jgi:hypothetical protein
MKRAYLGAAALALLTCGCMAQVDSKEADAVTAHFYQQLAAKQYEAIYQSSPELRSSATLELFTGMMSRIDRKLGPCGAPKKESGWRINVSTNGTMRDQAYSRVCANGKLSETVTTVTRDGKTHLAGYHANSPLLATD